MCCNSDSKFLVHLRRSLVVLQPPRSVSSEALMLTVTMRAVLFSVMVIQWVTSPDQPQASNPSSKNDSHELGSHNGEPDAIVPARRLGSGRRNNLSDLEDFDTPENPDDSQSRASCRRELSTEAMIDGRAAIAISHHNRTQSGSTDTLPSSKPFDLHVTPKPTAVHDQQADGHGRSDVTLPEEVRVRGNNLYVSRIWRSGP